MPQIQLRHGVAVMGAVGGYYLYQRDTSQIVIVGGGAMGTATAWSLSKRGHRCVLVDDGNPFKSSWGESRLVRDTQTSTILQLLMGRALTLWKEAGSDEFLHRTSVVTLLDENSKSDGDAIRRCSDLVGAPYKDISASEIERTIPQLVVPKRTTGIHHEGGWVIDARLAIQRMREAAESWGSEIIENDKVVSIDRETKTVHLESGNTIPFSKLVLCCGPKTNDVLKSARLSLMNIVPTAEQQNYFLEKDGGEGCNHSVGNMPSVITMSGKQIYLLPHMVGGVAGVKVSQHQIGPVVSNPEEGYLLPPGLDVEKFNNENRIDAAERGVVNELPLGQSEPSTSLVRKWVAEYLPGLQSVPHYSYRCLYTSSVKGDGPLLGPHPDDSNVILCAAFAGEGFKFAPAYGEAAANYAIGEKQPVDGIDKFDPARLAV